MNNHKKIVLKKVCLDPYHREKGLFGNNVKFIYSRAQVFSLEYIVREGLLCVAVNSL